MSKSKQLAILFQLLLLLFTLTATLWLWDHWMLNGPHGPYRWVGMDFGSYWVGVRGMFHGVDPFSAETTLKIQELVYGGPAMGEDPMLFSYPAWLFLPVAPLALLPYKWAAIIWVGFLLWAILNLLHKIASILGNNNFLAQSLWLIGLTLGTLPFLVISVMKGQLGCLSLLALFAAYQIWKRKPLLAGVILGLAFVKPTVTVAPVVVFLLWAFLQKNWKFLSGFAGSMAVLMAASYLAVGNWIPGYFEMLKVKVGFPVLWSMTFLPAPWNILYASLFIGIFLLSFYLSLKRNSTDWFSAAVLVGIALTPMRWIYDLFLAILILVDKRSFSPLQALMACSAILSPWLLVLVPVAMRWYVAVVGLPLIWAATVLSLILYEKREHREHNESQVLLNE